MHLRPIDVENNGKDEDESPVEVLRAADTDLADKLHGLF